jgi:hypothetical protein
LRWFWSGYEFFLVTPLAGLGTWIVSWPVLAAEPGAPWVWQRMDPSRVGDQDGDVAPPK